MITKMTLDDNHIQKVKKVRILALVNILCFSKSLLKPGLTVVARFRNLIKIAGFNDKKYESWFIVIFLCTLETLHKRRCPNFQILLVLGSFS